MAHAKSAERKAGETTIEPLDSLKPAAVNPRTHSAEQTASLAAIIRKYGWTRPIFYDFAAAETVVGHGASSAARLIFAEGEPIFLAPGRERGGKELPLGHVPVLNVSGWSEEERRAYLIADNGIAEQAGWDLPSLGSELNFLQDSGFDLSLAGLTGDIMADAFAAFDPPPADDFERSAMPPEAHEKAWRMWAAELAAQIEACSATGYARQGITPGYALHAFLRALHDGTKYPRHAQAAFHPDLYRIPGAAQSVLEGLASVVSGATDYRRLEFACGGKMEPRLLMSSPLPFGGGARIALDFPSSLAKALIDEFAPGGSVLDPCHGWGGRLVGFLLSSARSYQGTDPAPSTHAGVCKIRDLFAPHVPQAKTIRLDNLPAEEWMPERGADLILTSPPYFDVEKYEGGCQARLKHANYEDWRDGFYRMLIQEGFGWLREGGTFALQVGSQQYPLLADGKRIAKGCGFEVADVRAANMFNHFTETEEERGEVIIILRKP